MLERATQTPDGPASLRLTWDSEKARFEAWGAGRQWLLARVPQLCGINDDVSTFSPQHKVVRSLYGRNARLRIAATQTLWHDLAWFILQQRVSTKEASQQWRRFVMAWGEAAPGPIDLYVPPRCSFVARQNYTAFHPFGIDGQRSQNLIAAGRYVGRLGDLTDLPLSETKKRLLAIPGVGPWTAGYICATTFGDPDAIVLGDYHLPSTVAWALAGEARATDERMLELLQPFHGHRWRVCRMMMASGIKAPRYGPRRRILDIRRL